MKAHRTNVETTFNPMFGRTFQPVCAENADLCGYRGPHVATRARAEAMADEHTNRSAGMDVTVW